MNILLTELSALSLDLQEVPAVAQASADGFTQLFQQQLPVATDGPEQVIDYKDLFTKSPISSETPEPISTAPLTAGWQEFLAADPIRVSSDSDAVIAFAVDSPRSWPAATASLAIPVEIKPPTGEIFPASGNSLPQPGGSEKRLPAGVETGPAAREGLTPTALPPLQSGELNPIVAPITAAPVVNMAAKPAPWARSERVAPELTGQSASAAERPSLNPDVGIEAPLKIASARLRDPVAPITEAVVLKQAPPWQSLVSAPDTRNPISSTPPPPQRGFSEAILPQASANTPQANAETVSGTDKLVALATAPGREAATQNPPPAEPREIFRMPAMSSYPELASPDIAMTRQSDAPGPSTSTPPVAASVVSAPITAAPTIATAQPPLPLEPMSLARGADATEWGNGLGERVNWMINQKQNTATIRLDPPMLGKLDVQVRITDDATTITIQTQHSQARDLIESASTRLRDFLQDSGYQNVNVDVSQRQDQQQTRSQQGDGLDSDTGDESGDEVGDQAQADEQTAFFNGDGLVDTFA